MACCVQSSGNSDEEKRNKEIALEAFISELDKEREEDEENRTDSDEDSPKRAQLKKMQKNILLEKDLQLVSQILKKNPKQESIFYIGSNTSGQVLTL